jgi:hypothetical protein
MNTIEESVFAIGYLGGKSYVYLLRYLNSTNLQKHPKRLYVYLYLSNAP